MDENDPRFPTLDKLRINNDGFNNNLHLDLFSGVAGGNYISYHPSSLVCIPLFPNIVTNITQIYNHHTNYRYVSCFIT